MAITYGAEVSATYHRYQSTQSNPELCFIIVPNSRKLEEYSLEKISKPVNHPKRNQKRQICIQVDRLISSKRLGAKAFKWNLTTETITKLENRHAVLARLKEDTQIPAI